VGSSFAKQQWSMQAHQLHSPHIVEALIEFDGLQKPSHESNYETNDLAPEFCTNDHMTRSNLKKKKINKKEEYW
jgi:hypothetical protein